MFQEAIAQYLKQNHYESIQLKSVLFDMDGVLFDSMPYHAEAWHKTMKAHGLNLSREEAYMHEGRTGAGTINIVCQRQLGRDATQEEIESIYLEKSIEFNKHPQAERMPGAWELLQKIKYGKPNPEPYLMALEKGGLKPNEAIVIENAPLGVEAGHKAGIFTIAVNTGPLNGEILLNAGADLLFPSMQALCESWEKLVRLLH